jgi:hypothetical protein
MADAVEEEIAKGRLWRAKEILRGRLADAAYDPVLFSRYAEVLAAMGDHDEAGRYYLLAGCADGDAGALARAFVTRRRAMTFAQLWSQMPAAARRGLEDGLPAPAMDLLRASGFDGRVVKKHLSALSSRSKANADQRATLRNKVAEIARGERIGLVMAGIVLVVMAVGVVGTIRLIWWAILGLLG